jgi:hypothetical protein
MKVENELRVDAINDLEEKLVKSKRESVYEGSGNHT